jgi:hypothetical protein
LSIALHQTCITNNFVTDQFDSRSFHDDQLEVTPGSGYRLYVDGEFVASGPPRYHANTALDMATNRIAFGDATPTGGNAQVEITKLSFSQLRPEETAPDPEEQEDPVEQLIEEQPFAAMCRARPPVPVEKMETAAKALTRVIRQHSRKWKLGPNGVIVPRDFKE